MLDATLSRRERQIMEALYALGSAGAREVSAHLGEPEALDSVRVTLLGLQRKGLVLARTEGRRHVFRPARSRNAARQDALAAVTRVFFGGSVKQALVALLDQGRDQLDADDLAELEAWVKSQAGRPPKRGGGSASGGTP